MAKRIKGVDIILASASPRRHELFAYFNLPFRAQAARGIEELSLADSFRSAKAMVMRNARQKAEAVASLYRDALVIGADTIVFCNNKVFGKPKDKKEARRFLKELSHNPHWVYTGLCLINGRRFALDVDGTKVFMLPLTDRQIAEYVDKEENMDKAGAFAVQGLAGTFIYRIEGCFYNVMGLPLARLRKLLTEFGVLR